MMKLPGIASVAQGLTGEIGGAAASGFKSLQGGIGGAHARQENSDLSKVVEDLLHDKLMDKMGGGGAASGPLGGLQATRFGGGHGPMVRGGEQSPLQGARQENGDLMKVLSDLLRQRSGGAQGQPQALGRQGGENGDLMKLLADLLKDRSGGAQGAGASPFGGQPFQQAQAGGLQGENEDLMKLVADLLKDKSAAGDSGESGNPVMQLLQQQSEQLKGLQSMMQSQAA